MKKAGATYVQQHKILIKFKILPAVLFFIKGVLSFELYLYILSCTWGHTDVIRSAFM